MVSCDVVFETQRWNTGSRLATESFMRQAAIGSKLIDSIYLVNLVNLVIGCFASTCFASTCFASYQCLKLSNMIISLYHTLSHCLVYIEIPHLKSSQPSSMCCQMFPPLAPGTSRRLASSAASDLQGGATGSGKRCIRQFEPNAGFTITRGDQSQVTPKNRRGTGERPRFCEKGRRKKTDLERRKESHEN